MDSAPLSRRASLSSLLSTVDKEALQKELDQLHTTASRSDALTSFSDFDRGRPSSSRTTGPKELVSGRISGLYTRLRQSVGAGSVAPDTRPQSRNSHAVTDASSIRSVSRQDSPTALRSSQPQASPTVMRSSRMSHMSRTSHVSHMSRGSDASIVLPIDLAPTPPIPSSAVHSRPGSRDLTRSALTTAASSPTVRRSSFADQALQHEATESDYQQHQPAAEGKRASQTIDATRLPQNQDAKRMSSNLEGKRLSSNLEGKRHSSNLEGKRHSSNLDGKRLSQPDAAVTQLRSDAPFMRPRPERPLAAVQTDAPFALANARSEALFSLTNSRPEARQDADAPFTLSLTEAPLSGGERSTLKHPPSHLPGGERSMLKITPSHLPSLRLSQPSSIDGNIEPSSYFGSKPTTPLLDAAQNFNVGLQARRLPARSVQDASGKQSAVIPPHLKRRVISKEFWMKDENARDCFYCGDPFSTFRRKHHCRTCGQIFDAKCTVLVQGRPFGQSGTLRLCKPCEAIIYGSDDDSTVFSDEDDPIKSPESGPPPQDRDIFKPTEAALATPSIGIPVSRRNREAKRRSAVIEFDTQPVLARPSSSRSLKSMSGRPHSSSHKRHHSRHQSMRPLKTALEERGPFYQDVTDMQRRVPLPAFHNDNIIDPDLAPFLSDEGSDIDDQPSIFTTMSDIPGPSSVDHDRAGFAGLLASAVKKGRSRRGDRSIGGHSFKNSRDLEHFMLTSKHIPKMRKQRNPSIGSVPVSRPSPRRSRSAQNVMKSLETGATDTLAFETMNPLISDQAQVKRSSGMYGSNAPAVELNRASLQHVERLLEQLIKDSDISHRKHWKKALMPILLQCPNDVDPDVQNGDDMDIRNYIKIKKVPGGRPGDTSYISGIVFSKNIALKGMRRSFVRPRIVIITFALEYARHNHHFMSLEPVIAQEREFLRNLVGRIVALQPQILLVQRNVSGLALQMLQEAEITVVYNIKESVLAAVARMTQTVLIKSMDKLSIDPGLLGQCANFDVKTYVHGKVRKTYIWISGCQPDLGCTVVLRGGEMETLRQIKRITEFMCYVVYNLKLETCLMRDEFVLIPSSLNTTKSTPPNINIALAKSADVESAPFTPPLKSAVHEDSSTAEAHLNLEDQNFEMKPNALNHLVDAARHVVSEPTTATQEELEVESMPSEYRELIENARTRIISSSPFVKFPEPYLLAKAQDSEQRVEQSKSLRDRYDLFEAEDGQIGTGGEDPEKPPIPEEFEMILPEMIQQATPAKQSKSVRKFLRDVHDAQYQMALHEYDIKKRQWESFFSISNNNPFNPFSHQNIFVLHSLVSSVTSFPCAGPEILGLSFYAGWGDAELGLEEDLTLGQFIEDVCGGANSTCKQCNQRMFDHHRQYVHGTGQVSVSVKRYPSKFQNLHNTILMWSTCKICQQETTWIPMSDNTWKYSFGKYLELSYWSTALKPRAGVCPHDIHKDFVRCFAFQGLAVRVQWDKVELYDVLVPTATINWEVTGGLVLKNQLFTHFQTRLSAFIASIKARLNSINLSSVAPEKSADAAATLEKLVQRADSDQEVLLQKLQDKYMSSKYYEVIPLNRAVRMMDEKAIAWDEAFADFERNYFPSENDIRRLATLQLKKLFLDRGEAGEAPHQDSSDVDEGMEMQERPPSGMRLTDEDLQSEEAQSMLTSVVEEHGHSGVVANPNAPVAEEHKIEIPDGNMLPKQLSPSAIEQAIASDDVKHLDLAVPTTFSPENTTDQETPRAEVSPGEGGLDRAKSPEDFAVEPKPLNPTILERIEHMRSVAAATSSADAPLPESRIPRLVRSRGPVSPPLGRTQSQPDHIPKYNINTTSDMPVIQQFASGESSGATTPTPGKVQNKDLAKAIESRLTDRLGSGYFKNNTVKTQQSLIPRSVPTKTVDNSTRVSALAKHFEQLSREFERERLKERKQRAARRRQVRANPLASSRPVVEVYRDAREAVGERADDLKATPEGVVTEPPQPLIDPTSDQTQDEPSPEEHHGHDTTDHYATDTETAESTTGHTDTEAEGETTDTEHVDSSTDHKRDTSDAGSVSGGTLVSPPSPHDIDSHLELTLPKHEKSSLMKMLTSFWSERSASGWSPLEYPLLPTEHVFDDSDIIVREDEPASVIALALSSADYVAKQREFRGNPRGRMYGNGNHSHTASQSSSNFAADISSNDASQQSAIEASLISETGTHMKYSFAHGPVKATCKIFYAESFDALRRKCGVSHRFVESLSRCAKWDSKGGKTKSLFLKTLDDRFVIKSLQEVELKAFTKFAPDYFAFEAQSLFHGVPSVIAKMFGLFQVIIKNPANGVEFSSYLLVMENLFYSRNPTRRFDLKGSMRNRKIESTGQPDEVLLDENLVETIFETPLFVREHARKLLKASVWNDTMWLCRQNVMDYSLMAGFDDERKELVVGIIDCIRTYTWDKKLESWIKDRGKNKPTITSPKDYRNRFRVSMMQYVLQAPTVWHSFLAPGLPVGVTFGANGAVEVGPGVGQGQNAVIGGKDRERSTTGSWEGRGSLEEDRPEGTLLNDATIREMSTMTFA